MAEMKLDIIPEKKRKLTFAVFGLTSVLVMVFTGQVEGPDALSAIWKIVGAFMAGNGLEHLGKLGKEKLSA